MITSTSNVKIKNVIQLLQKGKQRKKQGLFIIEGIRLASEIPDHLLTEVYVSESFAKREEYQEFIIEKQKLKADGKLETFETVSDEVFTKMSDTVSPQGVLAVVKMLSYDAQKLIQKDNGTYMILEDVQDPGNLGTIMRTAEGAGVSAVFMSKGTVDIYNPKTIRSTMGSIFRMPFCYIEDICEFVKQMNDAGITTYAAHLSGEKYYDEIAYESKTAFMIGNEGNGLTDELTKLSNVKLKIPMEGQLESLNAAVSAAILMYEAHRQRR